MKDFILKKWKKVIIFLLWELKVNFENHQRKSKTIFLIDDIKSREPKKWNETWLLWCYPNSCQSSN